MERRSAGGTPGEGLATEAESAVAELTEEGVRGDRVIHVGTVHRFKGLEHQRLAIVGAVTVSSLTRPASSATATRARGASPVRN